MLSFRIGFDSPAYLWLLIALPLLWWMGYRSLGVLGRLRRSVALFLRSLVWTGFVLALAGIQLVWVTDRTTVMYLLDQSDSIPQATRQRMLDYVIRNVRRHRNRARQDRAGIVVFGRDAFMEIPPFDDNIPELRRLASIPNQVDAEADERSKAIEFASATNLETALNLAQASMPDDTSRRMVVVTDGNENLGQTSRMVARLAAAGIGIDVVPVVLAAGGEVLVEKIDLPKDIRKGQPIEARVVMTNFGDVALNGKLRVTQKVRKDETLLLEEPVTLEPGKNVIPMRHQLDRPEAYTIKAEFLPNTPSDDGLTQNNQASAYTYVRGKGRVLVIVERARENEYDLMIEALREANIEVIKQMTDELFESLAELQAYDAVILAGVPRISSGDGEISTFTDAQIEFLVRNTQQHGAGLLMVGGPEAFGGGGWTGTNLEKAMPVDFQIKNTKVRAVGALAMIMHASEMAEGNHWQKVVARKAIEQLGASDYAGVLTWQMQGERWLWGGKAGMLEVGRNRKAMMAAVGRLTPQDMPDFDPGMRMASAALQRTPASMKHCIIISDGDPTNPKPSTLQSFIDNKITITTVAVASHGLQGSDRLRSIATATGGKYYAVRDGRGLPKIYQREARRVAKPLVFEPPGGAVPEVIFPHALLDGIDRVLPSVNGFVLTQTKDSALAQVLIQSPKPVEQENATILAVWNFGLGRTAVLTTDTGTRWATDWSQWDGFDKFHSQLVRWLMRPTGDTGNFTLDSQVKDGQVKLVVNALDKDDSFLNFLEMNASATGPNMERIPLRMRQTAPGRYEGTFDSQSSGNYFVTVIPGPGTAPLTTGVSVPYSAEYRVRETNHSLLTTLASATPPGGQAGTLTEPLTAELSEGLIDQDPFRGGLPLARSLRDAWPWFVLTACCLFLTDVFVRRVAVDLNWIRKTAQNLQRKQSERDVNVTARLDALKRNKAEVSESLERQRASTRFVPNTDPSDTPSSGSDEKPTHPDADDLTITPKPEPKSYTERLLEAKRRANQDK